jgi:PPOX class probable F420-dependent enzyme
MSLMRRLIDAQYRFYDRIRHRGAFTVANRSGTAAGFEHMRGFRQALVVTFKRSGEPVPTPVNFGLADDGLLYFRTEPRVAKVKRIRNDPHVRVGPCNPRAKPLGPMAEGRARILPPQDHARAYGVIAANWSMAMKLYEKVADRLPVELAYVEVTPV